MQLRMHKYVLAVLFLFGLGLLLGTTLGRAYRSTSRNVAVSSQYAVVENATAEQLSVNRIPRKIAEMLRVDMITGVEAENIIRGYIGQKQELTGAYIATYKSNEKEVVIYSSELANPHQAERIASLMEARIKESESFPDFKLRYIYNNPVYFTTTQDENYCFFAKDTRIIWLTIKAGDSRQTIKDLYLYL